MTNEEFNTKIKKFGYFLCLEDGRLSGIYTKGRAYRVTENYDFQDDTRISARLTPKYFNGDTDARFIFITEKKAMELGWKKYYGTENN